MNLYNLHNNAEKLHRFEDHETIPEIFWNKYKDIMTSKNFKELLERKKHLLAKDPKYAFYYARYIKKPFPEGEDAIATNPHFSSMYSAMILDKPFPKGEPAIAKSEAGTEEYLSFWPERKEAIEKLK